MALKKDIIEELNVIPTSSAIQVIENKADHAMSSIRYIREMINNNFEKEIAEDLDRRLILAIQNGNPKKFLSQLKEIKLRYGKPS